MLLMEEGIGLNRLGSLFKLRVEMKGNWFRKFGIGLMILVVGLICSLVMWFCLLVLMFF